MSEADAVFIWTGIEIERENAENDPAPVVQDAVEDAVAAIELDQPPHALLGRPEKFRVAAKFLHHRLRPPPEVGAPKRFFPIDHCAEPGLGMSACLASSIARMRGG
ncbi:MAG: hypothetical protein B7Y84_13205 [Azorhizobium sp. 32-67-21]|nr:MAG: hypothetical protein B7Y84_13205 [Azorhizobium sp. 32-67-21]